MNDHSSRSHVIFTVTIERSDLGPDGKPHVRMGKLNLVDLAVSQTTPTHRHLPPSLPLSPLSPSLSACRDQKDRVKHMQKDRDLKNQ